MNQQQSLKTILTAQVITIVFINPITIASSECNVLALKHIKIHLRNSMTQQRLNQIMVLHIYQERTDALNLNIIAKEFAQANARRITFLDHIKIYLHNNNGFYM